MKCQKIEKIALSFAGIGTRAIFFNLGVIKALNEKDLLKNVKLMVSTSTSNIMSTYLLLNWKKFIENFDKEYNLFKTLIFNNRVGGLRYLLNYYLYSDNTDVYLLKSFFHKILKQSIINENFPNLVINSINVSKNQSLDIRFDQAKELSSSVELLMAAATHLQPFKVKKDLEICDGCIFDPFGTHVLKKRKSFDKILVINGGYKTQRDNLSSLFLSRIELQNRNIVKNPPKNWDYISIDDSIGVEVDSEVSSKQIADYLFESGYKLGCEKLEEQKDLKALSVQKHQLKDKRIGKAVDKKNRAFKISAFLIWVFFVLFFLFLSLFIQKYHSNAELNEQNQVLKEKLNEQLGIDLIIGVQKINNTFDNSEYQKCFETFISLRKNFNSLLFIDISPLYILSALKIDKDNEAKREVESLINKIENEELDNISLLWLKQNVERVSKKDNQIESLSEYKKLKTLLNNLN